MRNKLAYIFPGQGAQFVGMGKDLYENFSSSKEIFDTADDILGYSIKELCFEGPIDKLSTTEFSQVAILTVSIAALEALKESGFEIEPEYLAGLSLGEYSSLVASGSIDFETALRLVEKRGRFMHEASLKNPGQMASILGLSEDEVKEITEASGTYMVNFNCPGQIVISGRRENIKKAEELATDKGAKRFIVLKVSGAFHTRYMDEASKKLEEEMQQVEFKKPEVKIVFNVTADIEDEPDKIKKNLAYQVNHPTYWQRSIEYIQERGVNRFFEIGPGRILRGLLRRINPELRVYNIGSKEDIVELKRSMSYGFKR